MSEPEKEIVEHKVRRAVGIHALRKIGKIVAEEQQADEGKAKVVRWFLRYGWLVALGAVSAWAYWTGRI
ncbi:hypothetical protein FGKAn22_00720 [Ferrigenium kumadai]|uniref:Uncharacterized protein n=1 Tax=Ferrigenium kumadai TaxID=1682490 RepID=A0AAN1SZ52_9PROT|nr:hypothetical protein [Ferrigenium kumadai]BBI98379.1 hypothetical protein FGKAn22_00720 [Ferrigenium kumadai]